MHTIPDIPFAQVDGATLQLDLYLPARISQPAPVVVWVHGGAWRYGCRTLSPAYRSAYVQPLCDAGFAVASVDYRLSTMVPFPAQLHDLKGAVRWLRAHAAEYALNGTYIGALGISAGAHLSALLATSARIAELTGAVGGNLDRSNAIQAVATIATHSDLLAAQAQMDMVATPGRPIDAPDSFESLFMGFAIQEYPERTQQANPITFISADCPPFLLIHGSEDTTVPWAQSQLLAQALEAKGVAQTFLTVNGVGHDGPALRSAAVSGAIVGFMKRYLGSRTEESQHWEGGKQEKEELILRSADASGSREPGMGV